MSYPPAERSYRLVLVGSASYTCLMFIWFSLPAFLTPIVDEFGFSGTEAGILVGAIPLVYIPLALVTGVVVDRLGPGRTIATGVLLYGIAQVTRAFAVDFTTLLVPTIAIGVGATTITFGLPKLVAELFPPHRTGSPSSIYLLGAAAGSATVFAFGRPLLGPLLGGWRPLFFWSGVVAIVYGITWLAIALAAGIDDRPTPDESRFAPGPLLEDLRAVLGHRQLQLLVAIGTMYLFLTHGLQGWLPTILETRGLTPAIAGQTTSLFVIALAAGTLAVPPVADRLRIRRVALLACGSLTTLGVLVLGTGTQHGVVLAGVILAGLGVGGISPLLRAIPPSFTSVGPRLTGTAIGFVFAVGEIGGFFGPFLIGALFDVTDSFLPGLALLGSAGLVIVGAAALMGEID